MESFNSFEKRPALVLEHHFYRSTCFTVNPNQSQKVAFDVGNDICVRNLARNDPLRDSVTLNTESTEQSYIPDHVLALKYSYDGFYLVAALLFKGNKSDHISIYVYDAQSNILLSTGHIPEVEN